MIPTIALVGRPNVGKSTLFNCLTRTRDALVADWSGLTRDRQYGHGNYQGQKFIIIDTGGIEETQSNDIKTEVVSQTQKAIDEADAILWLVDAREGLTPTDLSIAEKLRQTEKTVHLVVNKIDGLNVDIAAGEFYTLGWSNLHFIAAEHRQGIRHLIEQVLVPFNNFEPEESVAQGLKIAVVGRPNVGKSTLVNRMLGEERVVVFDQPGTTRDSIDIHYEHHGKEYLLIDTAGVRRRKNIKEKVEKFSIGKTLLAIERAHVVVLVLDAREGIVDQDLHLLGYILESGRGIIIAINKWDGLAQDIKENIKSELERRLNFANFIRVFFISALHGTGVGHLYSGITEANAAAEKKWPTNELMRLLEQITFKHPPPLVRGRRIKLRYIHQGGTHPPLFIIHGKQTQQLPNSYKRYLENSFREKLSLVGTPIHFEFKTDDNPFAGRRNTLNKRQLQKRKRLKRHVKKSKK